MREKEFEMATSLDDLVPEIRDAAKELVRQCGVARLLPRVTSVLRSTAEQGRLYKRYLANQAGYPVAPPGLSAHEYGLAFDMVVSPLEALSDVGDVWNSWGGEWFPSDAVHFQYPGAQDIAKQILKDGVDNQEPWAMSALDFLLSFAPGSGPWWTGFVPEKYAGKPSQAYAVGGIGALIESFFR